MHDFITIGSALVDIFVKSDQFQLKKSENGVLLCENIGEKIEIDEFAVCTGGAAGNTAVGFARVGFSTAIVSETGIDNWSKLIIEDLHQEKVSTNLLIEEKKEQTGGSVILVGSSGGRTAMVHRGASSMLDQADIPIAHIGRAKRVHLSSLAGRLEALEAVFSAVARGGGRSGSSPNSPQLSWNPGKAELELLVSNRLRIGKIPCQVFLVNQEEWQTLGFMQQEIINKVEHVVITNGSQGGEVYFRRQHFPFVSRQVDSVDDTGAGDAFCVGYVSAVHLGKKPEEAVVWGVKNALSVIKYIGAKKGLLKKSALV
jgi:sugar/nucleoside kinase (ribokinase family)